CASHYYGSSYFDYW
nr:immunoglobulin heavy chain junction region [Mus musculus]